MTDTMQQQWLAERFEQHRPRLALNMLRSRATRREEPLDDVHVPDPIVDPVQAADPEHEALLADGIGLALLVVLDTLPAAERLAYVLHDMFAVPFDEIAGILDRSPDASRQLASRGRRRIRGGSEPPDADLDTQWELGRAFLAAARDGDIEGLVAVLDPDVVLRADSGVSGPVPSRLVRGAREVATQASMFGQIELERLAVLVNGAPGWLMLREGRPFSIGGFTVRGGRIVAIDILADPERLARLDLGAVIGPQPPAPSA